MKIDEIESLGLNLLEQNGLCDWKFNVLPSFVFDYLEEKAGYKDESNQDDEFNYFIAGICMYEIKQIALREDTALVMSEHKLRRTILHEIAHATRGDHGHDKEFKKLAKKLGGYVNGCGSI